MRIKNTSRWDTKDLSRFFRAGFKKTSTHPPELLDVRDTNRLDAHWNLRRGGWCKPTVVIIRLPASLRLEALAGDVEQIAAYLRKIPYREWSDRLKNAPGQTVLPAWAQGLSVKETSMVPVTEDAKAYKRLEISACKMKRTVTRWKEVNARIKRLETRERKLRATIDYYTKSYGFVAK